LNDAQNTPAETPAEPVEACVEQPQGPAGPKGPIESEAVEAAPRDAQGAPSPEVIALAAELERTRSDLERTSSRLDEIARAYSAAVNEQRDFRVRLEREKERVLEAERGKIAVVLLEIGDELDRALAAGGPQGPLGEGVRLIHEGLMRRLQVMGIERLSLLGRPFDPNLAEAVDLVPVSDPAQEGTVVAEAVPGYKLGTRVLRPARVRVARFVGEPAPQPAPPTDGGGAPQA
jgi:molecular chaperone GrpE